jgi:hypothetical protein
MACGLGPPRFFTCARIRFRFAVLTYGPVPAGVRLADRAQDRFHGGLLIHARYLSTAWFMSWKFRVAPIEIL